MSPGKIEKDARILKAANIWMKKRIEKENYLLSDIGRKGIL